MVVIHLPHFPPDRSRVIFLLDSFFEVLWTYLGVFDLWVDNRFRTVYCRVVVGRPTRSKMGDVGTWAGDWGYFIVSLEWKTIGVKGCNKRLYFSGALSIVLVFLAFR